MNSLVVITRLHYPEGHPDFDWRFNYYKEAVYPRLRDQTDKDFDIAVWCEPHHENLFKEIDPKIILFRAEYQNKPSKFFTDFTDWENVKGLKKYDIQLGLDSDDLVYPQIVEVTKTFCRGLNEKALFSFQPNKLDLKTGTVYKMKNYESLKRCPPCFALYQPDENDYKFAYYRDHYRLPGDFEKTIYIDGLVTMTVHDLNDSTTIKPKDIPLKQ